MVDQLPGSSGELPRLANDALRRRAAPVDTPAYTATASRFIGAV
jgi:hypothetical protein